jgi:hypothetical protein
MKTARRNATLAFTILGTALYGMTAAQGCGSSGTSDEGGAEDASADSGGHSSSDGGGPSPSDGGLDATLDAALATDAALDGGSDADAQVNLPTIQVSTSASGIKQFSAGGALFVPIGVNDVSKVAVRFPDDSGTYDGFDLFDTSNFDLASVDQTLAAIAANGFNYVRLWLKSADTEQGFSAIPGGLSQAARWQLYVSDVVATIHSAESHGLHVVLTGQFPGSDNDTFLPLNYYSTIAASLPPTTQVDSLNRLLLLPAMGSQLGLFYHDLLTAMIGLDPAIRSAIFYIDAYNETDYKLDSVPLNSGSGTFVYGGTTYDLSDFSVDPTDLTSRQSLMDRATQAFIQTVSTQVRGVMPDMLVTASSGYNYGQSPSHGRFDGGRIVDGGVPDGNSYMLRPHFVLAGGADLLDFHLYPSSTSGANATIAAAFANSNELFAVDAAVTATSVSAADAPLIAGEYDGNEAKFGFEGSAGDLDAAAEYLQSLDAGIDALRTSEANALCYYGFQGFAFWNWNDLTAGSLGSTFALVAPDDPAGEMMHFIAPKYDPTFCGARVAPIPSGASH